MIIIPHRNALYMYLLFFWTLAWTTSGLYILMQGAVMKDKNYHLFLFIYFFFWMYFEIMVVKVFHWRKWGKEVLIIQKGKIIYEKHIFFRKKIRYADLHLASECRIIPFNEKLWSDFFTNSFWHIGKERLEIQAGVQRILFGFQLSDKEASDSAKQINHFRKIYSGD